jgi:predicted O-linked N-acetylglucosamine transferase (SPINDLY family)
LLKKLSSRFYNLSIESKRRNTPKAIISDRPTILTSGQQSEEGPGTGVNKKRLEKGRGQKQTKKKGVSASNQILADAIDNAIRYHQDGNIQQAEVLYRQIIQEDPDNADALHLLGLIAYQKGESRVAVELIEKAIAINDSSAMYHSNLGNVQKEIGEVYVAIEHYEKALSLKPDFPEALNNIGLVFKEQGRHEEAIEHYKKAIGLKADYAEAHDNLGRAFQDLARLDDALECYRKAISLKSDFVDAYNNLGLVLNDKGRLDEAEASFRKALHLRPNCLDAYNNLGFALKAQGRLNEAIECYRKAIQLKPEFAPAHNNLGRVFKSQGRINDALECFQKALQLRPDAAVSHSNILFCLHCDDQVDSVRLFSEHKRWAEYHGSTVVATTQTHGNDRALDRRLRIGYVSPDFRTHSVAYFIEPVIASHNRADFEIFCYSNVVNFDAVTTRLRGLVEHWRDIIGVSDEKAAEVIREDKIDILVDLAGHTSGNRLLLFARKPVPIQVTYLGYPNTTGLPTIDYRITDSLADPPGTTDHLCVEKLFRLPKSFLCYRPPQETPSVSTLPAIRTGNITFGSFNNRTKLTPTMIGLWSQILKSIPNARLVLKSGPLFDAETRELLEKMFVQHGISQDQLRLLSYVPSKYEHFDCYNSIDIGLDTFPYNGTTTTCEAMWMGVPVISLAGETHASRVGMSLLSDVGLSDFIAECDEDYLQKAVALANDLERLQSLRVSLRSMMSNSSLMDARSFTDSLEKAYRQMWYSWSVQAEQDRFEENQDVLVNIEKVPETAKMLGSGRTVSVNPQVENLIEVSREDAMRDPDKKNTKPTIRILHHMARSGGTVISKCLGCMEDVILLSEIHPLGLRWFNPLYQAQAWFHLFTPQQIEMIQRNGGNSFENAIPLIYEKCLQHGKTLVIRDWSHLDFVGIPFLEKPSYKPLTPKVLSNEFDIVSTATVRHPIDEWLSLRSLRSFQWKITLEEFLRGYLRFAEYFSQTGFIRYEDFTESPEKEMKLLCKCLCMGFDPAFKKKWWKYTTITGDNNSVRGHSREIKRVPRKTMEAGLIREFERNADYIRSIQILGYMHPG